jgi:hypothetical protein
VPFTRFYNTVVLGSFVIALVCFVPVIFGARWLLAYYHAHWKEKVNHLGIMKLFSLTKAVDLLDKHK